MTFVIAAGTTFSQSSYISFPTPRPLLICHARTLLLLAHWGLHQLHHTFPDLQFFQKRRQALRSESCMSCCCDWRRQQQTSSCPGWCLFPSRLQPHSDGFHLCLVTSSGAGLVVLWWQGCHLCCYCAWNHYWVFFGWPMQSKKLVGFVTP